MYLWQRGNSYVFQIRVPQPYVRRISSAHLRRNLGRVSRLEARHRAIILADGLLRILAIADVADIPPTDEEIVAACNWWLKKRSWRETLQSTVDELLPADLFAQRDSITRKIFEVWTEPDIDEETGQCWAREYNNFDEVKEDFGRVAMKLAGYADPDIDISKRAGETLERLIDAYVQRRVQELLGKVGDDGMREAACRGW